MHFKKENIIPHFQPIISIDNNDIFGFELLGRYIDKNNNIQSLGAFFSDPSNSDDITLHVDRIVREKGIKEFSLLDNNDKYLFINMRLSWLKEYVKNPQDMPTIKWADMYGVNYSNIVIEITEEDVGNCSDFYLTALSYYKSLGFKIAIDDYGCKNSDIYRLAEISPDIVKIDMTYVQKSENLYQYRHYLKLITEFADNIGVEVIYEGVENSNQLTNCINSQGRFYQGFFLSKPLPTLKKFNFDKEAFKRCTYSAIISKQTSIQKNKNLQLKIDTHVYQKLKLHSYNQIDLSIDEYLNIVCEDVPSYFLRLYICNRYGFQLSSNFEFSDNTMKITDFYNRNWAWRGYFVNALRAINDTQLSYLTQSYRDVSTKELICTYVRKVDNDTFLFIDISKNELVN